MKYQVPFSLRDQSGFITVEYSENKSADESGFSALLDFPYDRNVCIGYSTLHAYFENSALTGYKRLCGWIQIVERKEMNHRNGDKVWNQTLLLDVVDEHIRKAGLPYFAFGFPAELYDAPCKNLGNCEELTWTAYTYLVDIPSRLNLYKLSCLAGFSWGYIENSKGPVSLLDFKLLDQTDWMKHLPFIQGECPVLKK